MFSFSFADCLIHEQTDGSVRDWWSGIPLLRSFYFVVVRFVVIVGFVVIVVGFS